MNIYLKEGSGHLYKDILIEFAQCELDYLQKHKTLNQYESTYVCGLPGTTTTKIKVRIIED